jgi:hypothetical protein
VRMTKVLVVLFVLVWSLPAYGIPAMPAKAGRSSDGIAWFAHGGITIPRGDFSNTAGIGFGGGVGGILPYSETVNLRGQVGYTYLEGKELDTYGDGDWDLKQSMIPFWFLGEYKFDPVFYGVGGLGFVMVRYSIEYNDPYLGYFEDSGSDTEFGFTFGGGYRMSEVLNLEARYSNVDEFNYISFEALYYF